LKTENSDLVMIAFEVVCTCEYNVVTATTQVDHQTVVRADYTNNSAWLRVM
jgi:hypothetical protein